MATYVVLFDWTEQGIKGYKDSPKRVDAAGELFSDLGVRIKDIYWTLGPYDLVAIIEAPDDEKLTTTLLALGALGNVRSTTLRAYTREEFTQLI